MIFKYIKSGNQNDDLGPKMVNNVVDIAWGLLRGLILFYILR